jgi:hypothetical protein
MTGEIFTTGDNEESKSPVNIHVDNANFTPNNQTGKGKTELDSQRIVRKGV